MDVTLSAGGNNLKAHKVVLSACSSYFRDLLKGISLWQHPVLVLKDVRFLELQSILEFVYLGEVNVEQDRLESFLKTAELLRIKGLTDGLQSDRAERADRGWRCELLRDTWGRILGPSDATSCGQWVGSGAR